MCAQDVCLCLCSMCTVCFRLCMGKMYSSGTCYTCSASCPGCCDGSNRHNMMPIYELELVSVCEFVCLCISCLMFVMILNRCELLPAAPAPLILRPS